MTDFDLIAEYVHSVLVDIQSIRRGILDGEQVLAAVDALFYSVEGLLDILDVMED